LRDPIDTPTRPRRAGGTTAARGASYGPQELTSELLKLSTRRARSHLMELIAPIAIADPDLSLASLSNAARDPPVRFRTEFWKHLMIR